MRQVSQFGIPRLYGIGLSVLPRRVVVALYKNIHLYIKIPLSLNMSIVNTGTLDFLTLLDLYDAWEITSGVPNATRTLGDLYRGGHYVQDWSGTSSIPTTGLILFSNFYGTGTVSPIGIIAINLMNSSGQTLFYGWITPRNGYTYWSGQINITDTLSNILFYMPLASCINAQDTFTVDVIEVGSTNILSSTSVSVSTVSSQNNSQLNVLINGGPFPSATYTIVTKYTIIP